MPSPDIQRTPDAHASRTGAPPPSLINRIDGEIRDLYPGYFALVMATGIVSNAALYIGHHGLSQFLMTVNLVACWCWHRRHARHATHASSGET